jgi:hypothetical protein
MPRPAYLLFLFAATLATLAAQSTSASIVGTIRDPHSAVIHGAVVSASTPERGWETKTTTGEDGSYTFYPVPPGLYRLTIEAPGFQPKSVIDFQVDLDSRGPGGRGAGPGFRQPHRHRRSHRAAGAA